MADDKKGKGKPAGKPADKGKDKGKPAPAPESSGIETEIIFFGLLALFIFFTIIPFVYKMTGLSADFPNGIADAASRFFVSLFNTVSVFSVFLSLLLLMGTIYANFKRGQIQVKVQASISEKEKEVDREIDAMTADNSGGINLPGAGNAEYLKPVVHNEKWQTVLKLIDSSNSADWKVAIMEADIILYEMLDKMGYEGDTIAEKLKQIEKSDFQNLDEAWRAHKVRNIIAHEGSSFILSNTEARKTIDQYKKVFDEFYFI